MPGRQPLVILVGPTAVGKTELSIRVAKTLGAEIVIADSRQVYRGMDIGTSKPTESERRRVPHHLLDVADPRRVYSAGRYQRAAIRAIREIAARGRLPMLVGGTGLYIRSVIYGLWRGPRADWALRRRWESEARRRGSGVLHRRLESVDPESSVRIHPSDRQRVIRALEVYRLTGIPLSAHHARHGFRSRRYRTLLIGLRRERADLVRRIDRRVDRMVEQGWLSEVERLLASGVSPDAPGMQGIGYRRLAAALTGRCGLDVAVAQIKRETRQYAKRQMTWFGADSSIEWINLSPRREAREIGGSVLRRIRSFLAQGEQEPSGRKEAGERGRS